MLLPCLVFFFLSLCYVETKKKGERWLGSRLRGLDDRRLLTLAGCVVIT